MHNEADDHGRRNDFTDRVMLTTSTHGMPGRRELLTRLSYALSAAASISSDAVPVGNVPCGDET